MPDSKFDLGDYVEVKDRLRILYELFGTARVTTSYELTSEPDEKPKVICRALVYRTPDDPLPSTGTSWMYLPGSTSYTKLSEIENAETSAVGRAIGMMGILIDRSIATSNEIDAKREGPAPERNLRKEQAERGSVDGGLIGIAEKNDKMTADYHVRQSPEGPFLGFRIKDGSGPGVLVEAHGPMAEALAVVESEVIGQRVQVWGPFVTHTFANKPGGWKAVKVERIQTEHWTLPAMEALGHEVAADELGGTDPSAPSIPAFTDAELADLDTAAA